MTLTPGVRVIRGFDWVWGDQDGGAGGVGTVCEIGMPISKRSPDKTVVVNWDCGIRSNYRVGYQGSYDLIILDNAQCGVRHPDIGCDSCKQNGLVGIRYKCASCPNCNLCSLCYHNDKHNLEHTFIRFITPSSLGIPLTARSMESKLCIKGIFSGAIVQRGHDWKWDTQDGGEGKTGYVTEICNWGTESQRSVACVTWHIGYKNDYRVGHKGIMDLKYATPAIGGYYYVNHLPVLGKKEDVSIGVNEIQEPEASGVSTKFSPGDRVKVLLDVETLKSLQQGHGGWNPRMTEYIGKVGVVHRITERGDVRVQYEGCANRWTFHFGALELVPGLRVGDEVQLLSDAAVVCHLQRQHCEWKPAMEKVLGKSGKIINLYHDGNLRIQISDGEQQSVWIVHPQCVKRTQKPSAPISHPSGSSGENKAQTESSSVKDNPELRLLMSKVAQGNLEYVKEVREKNPLLLDASYCGKTALQVAAYQGHGVVVRELLAGGAQPGSRDLDGDTALHDAAFGNQPEILEILLNHPGVEINTPNRSHCTALHIAAHKCLPHCVTVLLRYSPNINMQDTYGDTALHDAINYQCGTNSKERASAQRSDAATNVPVSSSHRIIQMLCDHPGLDFSITNKRGFNVLQHAALKGNAFACEAICRQAPQLVNTVKDDGFSALHLAALNGHKEAVSALVQSGDADLNLRNNRQQTPLLLAISQGHPSVIELLVTLGCDITALDEDGNSTLHIVAMKRSNMQVESARPNYADSPGIHIMYEQLGLEQDIGSNRLACAIALFFIYKGCDPEAENKDNKTCFELLNDEQMAQILRRRILTLHEDMTGTRRPDSEDIPQLGPMEEIRLVERIDGTIDISTRPNSTRKFAFSGPEDNVNHSPFRRNYNYNYCNELVSNNCSANSSPMHRPCNPNDTPTRPSRSRTSRTAMFAGRAKSAECMVCCELSENCQFEPCGHRVACEDCASRMKKCLACGVIIERRRGADGQVLLGRSRQPSAERLRYLEGKLQELEETHGCSICMERRRTIAFMCGHQACGPCAATLTTCHMCRQPLTAKIQLY